MKKVITKVYAKAGALVNKVNKHYFAKPVMSPTTSIAANKISVLSQQFTDNVNGHIDLVDSGSITGWLVKDQQTITNVTVYVDDQKVPVKQVVIERSDVLSAIGCGLDAGFILVFSQANRLCCGQHKITLVDSESAETLVDISVDCKQDDNNSNNKGNEVNKFGSSQGLDDKQDMLTIISCDSGDAVEGCIDQLTYYNLTGWVINKDADLNTLSVYVDGVLQPCHILPVNRQDVLDVKGYGFYSGFNLVFLQPLQFTGETQTLTLTDTEEKKLLSITFCKKIIKVEPIQISSVTSTELDVIVPVYLGVEETLNCLNSIITAKTQVFYRLIIINDCSPDKAIHQALRDFVKTHKSNKKIHLHENRSNLGFVKTVNKGMKLSKTNDVVLLNADTEVSDYWLDKLQQKLQTQADIATVTPFSNQATIFSFPVMNPTSDYAEIASIKTINSLLEKYNAGCCHDVPTAHGFCMLIRRACINDIGVFDEDKWAKGYCEENDFSIKAMLKGWRNVIACDTYVRHVGSVSFQDESNARISTNLALLNQLYPFYLEQVADFITVDPLSVYRNKILSEQLINKVKNKKHIILHVIHSLGGGTEHAMKTLTNLIKNDSIKKDTVNNLNACSIVLRSLERGRTWRVECEDQQVFIDFKVNQGIDEVVSLLKDLAITHIHYHQLLEFDNNVRLLPSLLHCQYDITLHDYYLMCPKVNLLNDKGLLCTGPEVAKCYSCIKNSGAMGNQYLSSEQKIQDFFNNNQAFLNAARYNIAPTKGVKTLFTQLISGENIIIKAHPEPYIKRSFIPYNDKNNVKSDINQSNVVNVAILGAIGEHKGSLKLKALVDYADENNLPIRFVVIGYSTKVLTDIKSERLLITGKYNAADLPLLIEKYQCEQSLFISPWPETYSYTLSEALQYGLYPVALALGAYKDRLTEYGIGTLLSLELTETDICNKLLSIDIDNIEYEIGQKDYLTIYDYYGIK